MSRASMMRSKVAKCASGWMRILSSCAPFECCANCRHQRVLITMPVSPALSWVLISPTLIRAHHLLRSQTCLHMPYEMSRVFIQPVSFRAIIQVSIATIIQNARGQAPAKRLRHAHIFNVDCSSCAAMSTMRLCRARCVACVVTLHPSLLTRSVVCSDTVTVTYGRQWQYGLVWLPGCWPSKCLPSIDICTEYSRIDNLL